MLTLLALVHNPNEKAQRVRRKCNLVVSLIVCPSTKGESYGIMSGVMMAINKFGMYRRQRVVYKQ